MVLKNKLTKYSFNNNFFLVSLKRGINLMFIPLFCFNLQAQENLIEDFNYSKVCKNVYFGFYHPTAENQVNDTVIWHQLSKINIYGSCNGKYADNLKFVFENRPSFNKDEINKQYIQGRLIYQLKKGKKYNLSFHLKGFGKTNLNKCLIYYNTSNIIHELKIFDTIKNKKNLTKITRLLNKKNSFTTEVSEDFISIGNEKYFYIKIDFDGRFNKDFEISNISIIEISEKEEENIESDTIFNNFELESDQIFEFDKYEVAKNKQLNLDSFILNHFVPNFEYNTITIIGHTDSIGKKSYNQKLSERRADVVKKRMVELGIYSNQWIIIGKGEDEIKYPFDIYKNRRVEFIAVP
jgi:hypothetical protein